MACMQSAEIAQLDADLLDGRSGCDCLPACAQTTYEVDATSSPVNMHEVFRAYGLEQNDSMSYARLTVSFNEAHYTPQRRVELYSTAELVALVGGLLALFGGVSVLGLVELLYVCGWNRWASRASLREPRSHQLVAMNGGGIE